MSILLIAASLGSVLAAIVSLCLGAGLWQAFMWYVVGCWAGFLISLFAILLLGALSSRRGSRLVAVLTRIAARIPGIATWQPTPGRVETIPRKPERR